MPTDRGLAEFVDPERQEASGERIDRRTDHTSDLHRVGAVVEEGGRDVREIPSGGDGCFSMMGAASDHRGFDRGDEGTRLPIERLQDAAAEAGLNEGDAPRGAEDLGERGSPSTTRQTSASPATTVASAERPSGARVHRRPRRPQAGRRAGCSVPEISTRPERS